MLFLVSCGGGKKGPEKKDLDITGIWQLTSVSTKASVGNVQVDVYIEFAASSFTIYQKIGEGRYKHFTGTYVLEGTSLSGKYSDNKPWGAVYDVTRDGETLVLGPQGGTEKDTYKKVSSIPSSVTDNIY